MKEQSAEMTSALMKRLAEQPEAYPCVFLYGTDEKAEQCAELFLRSLSSSRPSASSCLTDAEAFRADCLAQLRGGSAAHILEQYWCCDVLMMFNVEKLSGMPLAQERLYGLFDAICESGKQILLFSACAPHAIPKLENRNLTQFVGSLVWPMNGLQYKTKD